jgi:hypothetical protein
MISDGNESSDAVVFKSYPKKSKIKKVSVNRIQRHSIVQGDYLFRYCLFVFT